MKKNFLFMFFGIVIGQTLPTVPNNVFRLSIGADVSNHKWNLGEKKFSLHGIALHYFDPYTHNDSLRFSSNFDLFYPGSVYLDSSTTVEAWLNSLNEEYSISLPNLGPQNIDTSSSMLYNGFYSEYRERKTNGKIIKIDYGMSNEVTLSATIPFMDIYTINQSFSDYSINPIQGAQALVNYHQIVKNNYNTFFNSSSFSNLPGKIQDTLEMIYNIYYKPDMDTLYGGDYSVNWVFQSQDDPINNLLIDPRFIPNGINKDSVSLSDLVNYYYPTQKSSNGYGDISVGVTILLKGEPSWAIEEPVNSLYGQISLSIPFGKTISSYKDKGVGKKQFTEVNMGYGVNRWKIGFYGNKEFKSKMQGRLFVQSHVHFSTVTTLNTPVLLFSGGHTHQDSILSLIGNTYKYNRGTGFSMKVGGEFEPKKNRLRFLGEISPVYKGKDNYSSKDPVWDNWMENQIGSSNYIDLKCEIWLINSVSKYRFGPYSFDLFAGYNTTLLANNNYLGWNAYAGIITFYQGW